MRKVKTITTGSITADNIVFQQLFVFQTADNIAVTTARVNARTKQINSATADCCDAWIPECWQRLLATLALSLDSLLILEIYIKCVAVSVEPDRATAQHAATRTP